MVKKGLHTLFVEPAHSAARTWAVAFAVVIVWILGGVAVWKNPMPVVAEAVLQVPPGTDPETLCNHPELRQAALQQLAELKQFPEPNVSAFSGLENPPTKLSGTISGKKSIDGTWKLAYRAPNSELAVSELTALVTQLEQHLSVPNNEKAATERQKLEDRLRQLNAKQAGILEQKRSPIRFPDQASSDFESEADLTNAGVEEETSDSNESIALKERVLALQRAITEARIERLRTEEELELVEANVIAGKKLEAIANQLPAGPIQDAVRHVDRQARLSSELKQVNTTLAQDSEIYGDKHPRLIDLRRRFERLLQDVGGWEQLLAESSVRDQLMTSLEQVLELRRQRESDLQIQFELEQSELQDQTQMALSRLRTSDALKDLKAEITDTQRALSDLNNPVATNFIVIRAPAVSSSLTVFERSWPWLAVIVVGLLFGWGVSQIPRREKLPDYESSHEVPLLTVPHVLLSTRVAPDNNAAEPVNMLAAETLDLAQRRAARQARWQQTYA